MHHFCWSHCVKLEVIVLGWGIFLKKRISPPQKKITRHQNNHKDDFTHWVKQRWCEIITVNSLITAISCISACIWRVSYIRILSNQNIVLSVSVLIPVWTFQSIQTYMHCTVWQTCFYAKYWRELWAFRGKYAYRGGYSHIWPNGDVPL